ncbi:hypothetical protein B6D29_02895 [Microgenomates bacterium UTCPR1]|nr:MAG: hypothetical protein B6D29_02895 [Microgenomates bacterium UTCPR1]
MVKKTSTKSDVDFKETVKKLEDTIEEYMVDKAPFQIPENIKELLVKIAPWLSLIGLIFGLPLILVGLGMGAVLAPFAFLGGVQAGVSFGLGMIISLVVLVMQAVAIPGLFKRSAFAWKMMFYASLVTVVQNVAGFNLFGLVVGTLISWYLLFQVKSYYK